MARSALAAAATRTPAAVAGAPADGIHTGLHIVLVSLRVALTFLIVIA
jgi:hypothetical protein